MQSSEATSSSHLDMYPVFKAAELFYDKHSFEWMRAPLALRVRHSPCILMPLCFERDSGDFLLSSDVLRSTWKTGPLKFFLLLASQTISLQRYFLDVQEGLDFMAN